MLCCCGARRPPRSINNSCPSGPQQQTRHSDMQWSIDGTGRRTDTVPLHRPCRVLCQLPAVSTVNNFPRRLIVVTARSLTDSVAFVIWIRLTINCVAAKNVNKSKITVYNHLFEYKSHTIVGIVRPAATGLLLWDRRAGDTVRLLQQLRRMWGVPRCRRR